MANRESVRPARTTASSKGKLWKKSEEPLRALDVYWEEIQKTGWTPEIEADVFAAPSRLHIQPELLKRLMTDAGRRDDVKLWRLLACIYESNNDEQAATCATAALQLQPTDTTAMGVLAKLCEKRQAEQEAVGWHRRILEVDPAQVHSIRFLAVRHYQRGEYDTALQYLQQLIELEPKVRTNKLYWLLSMVKNSGVHGLAQPLTEVRRWRALTSEEAPLAYELFLLVAKLCLQTRQRARARQYLTRALQLDPTPEVEALLDEASDQPLSAVKATPTAATVTPTPMKTPVAILHPSEPIRLKYPVVPHPPAVLPEGAWNRRLRIRPILTSGVGALAVLIVVAVLVIWSMPDDPPLAPLPSSREKRAVLPHADVVSPASKQEGASLNHKPVLP